MGGFCQPVGANAPAPAPPAAALLNRNVNLDFGHMPTLSTSQTIAYSSSEEDDDFLSLFGGLLKGYSG